MGNQKVDKPKNWLLVKNLHFLSNPYETWWKWLSHGVKIFTKFHKNWTEIRDFLLMANFWTRVGFFYSDFINKTNFWTHLPPVGNFMHQPIILFLLLIELKSFTASPSSHGSCRKSQVRHVKMPVKKSSSKSSTTSSQQFLLKVIVSKYSAFQKTWFLPLYEEK